MSGEVSGFGSLSRLCRILLSTYWIIIRVRWRTQQRSSEYVRKNSGMSRKHQKGRGKRSWRGTGHIVNRTPIQSMREIQTRFGEPQQLGFKKIPCARCLVPRLPSQLGAGGTCLAVMKCEKEYRELLRIGPLEPPVTAVPAETQHGNSPRDRRTTREKIAIAARLEKQQARRSRRATPQMPLGMGVASHGSMPHNGGVPTGGTTEAQEVIVAPPSPAEITEVKSTIHKAYEMLAAGTPITEIQRATRLSENTLLKMRDHAEYQPSPVRIIAQRAGAVKREADRKKSGRINGQPIKKGEPMSLRGMILNTLRDGNGRADTSGALARDIMAKYPDRGGISTHEVQHILQSGLSRSGLVKYREDKQGNTKIISDIRLTTAGWRETGGIPPAAPALEPLAPAAPPKTMGGVPLVPPEPKEQSRIIMERAPVMPPAPIHGYKGAGEPAEIKYPLIKALLTKGSKIRAAARLLDEAGLTEAADLIRNETPKYEGLEAEVVRLIEEHKIDI